MSPIKEREREKDSVRRREKKERAEVDCATFTLISGPHRIQEK